jgi:glycosyltransferase involved in cell wall biosynthesis
MTVAALTATKSRDKLLVERAVPAVLRQTRQPDTVVVVHDGPGLDDTTRGSLKTLAAKAGVELTLLHNIHAAGPGGAWNTGLAHLVERGHRGFVAILDDDDVWDPDHLEVNLEHAEGATIVVSGLQMLFGGRCQERPLLGDLDPRAFLTGNPGWQGSNTFVDLDLLVGAGGFREGLPSLNDRDLAIRLLRHPRAAWRLTGRWTASWYADTPGNLSEARSQAKRDGLRAFWLLYGDEMSPDERARFFDRAEQLFGVAASEITTGEPELRPPLGFPRSATCV